MKLYRIDFEDACPKIEADLSPHACLADFHGEPKAGYSPGAPFKLEAATPLPPLRWNQFYSFRPGSLLLPGCAWEKCDDMYYNLASGGTEILSMEIGGNPFFLLNPTDFPPRPTTDHEPFDTKSFFAVLFRLSELRPNDLYSLSAPELSGDDFKKVYDDFGFRGLKFTEIWNSCPARSGPADSPY